MNTPVSIELAKLLKEKGFNEEVRDYYEEKDGTFYYSQYFRDNVSINEKHKGFVTAPTIAEVVMWLYEKYKIWISVICDAGNDLLFTFKIYSTKIGEERCIVNGNMYESPTEDYEAAIEYTLKNLI